MLQRNYGTIITLSQNKLKSSCFSDHTFDAIQTALRTFMENCRNQSSIHNVRFINFIQGTTGTARNSSKNVERTE